MRVMKGWSTIAVAVLPTVVSWACSAQATKAEGSNMTRAVQAAFPAVPGYLIAELSVEDFARFQKEYAERTMPILQRHGARPIVATQVVDVREGTWNGNWTVILEFPSRAAAAGFYAAADYQPLISVRKSLARFQNIVLVDGVAASGAADQTAGKSYLIARIDVRDFERFEREYGDKVGSIVQRIGARVLVASQTVDLREGEWRANWTVVIEFPSHQAAAGFYDSAEYQALVPVRKSVTRSGSMVFARGFSVPPATAPK